MKNAIAIMGLVALFPLTGAAQDMETFDPRLMTDGDTGSANCVLPPREGDQAAYLELLVGAEGMADDDAFRLSEGAPCLTLQASGG